MSRNEDKSVVFTLLWFVVFFPVAIYRMWKYKKFSEKTRILITSIVFFPYGVYYIWKHNKFDIKVRVALTTLATLLLLSIATSEPEDVQANNSGNTANIPEVSDNNEVASNNDTQHENTQDDQNASSSEEEANESSDDSTSSEDNEGSGAEPTDADSDNTTSESTTEDTDSDADTDSGTTDANSEKDSNSNSESDTSFETTTDSESGNDTSSGSTNTGTSSESEENTSKEEEDSSSEVILRVVILEVDKVDEYVILKNTGNVSVNLKGWKILSVLGEQDYDFSDYQLSPGETVKVGDSGRNDDIDLHWLEGRGVWNNSEPDRAELYNVDGKLVSSY